MRCRCLFVLLNTLLVASLAEPQTAIYALAMGQTLSARPIPPTDSNTNALAGLKIRATLTKSLDSRRNKPGDEVRAKTSEDVVLEGIVIPRNSKLIGHITVATAARRTADSFMGIVFDRAMLKKGKSIPLSATIQALSRHTTSEMIVYHPPDTYRKEAVPDRPMGPNAEGTDVEGMSLNFGSFTSRKGSVKLEGGDNLLLAVTEMSKK